MTSAEANAEMQAHFRACPTRAPHGTGALCCARGRELYSNYLTARAAELGLHPESFPGVRAWMREQGEMPMPMSDAMGINRERINANGRPMDAWRRWPLCCQRIYVESLMAGLAENPHEPAPPAICPTHGDVRQRADAP
jgi:hypothetical protein